MFRTRLNPTKPPAAYRAVLERVGAACRELRPVESDCLITGRANDQVRAILEKHGVLGVGTPAAEGGAGDDALLVAMAAERIGREGLRLARWFAVHVAYTGATQFDTQLERASPDRLAAEALLPADVSSNVEARISEILVADDHFAEPASPELIYRVNLKLSLAAGMVGVIADCIDTLVDNIGQTEAAATGAVPPEIERYVALTAENLEATRAITYAAAELKFEFDRRPQSEHLRLEAMTLVNESLHLACHALEVMFAGSREALLAGKPLNEYLPPRLRAYAAGLSQILPHQLDRSLAKQIARYYLFQ